MYQAIKLKFNFNLYIKNFNIKIKNNLINKNNWVHIKIININISVFNIDKFYKLNWKKLFNFNF